MSKTAKKATSRPKTESPVIGVILADPHCSLATLEPASFALGIVAREASYHNVPLIIAGDLFDGKALLRAECVNRVRLLLSGGPGVWVIPGNHDRINERSAEHSLHCIEDAKIHVWDGESGRADAILYVPYCSDSNRFAFIVRGTTARIVIGHQGIKGADMGHYIRDASAVDPRQLEGQRIILGHYHKRQDIGNISFLGSPYTINFGEANDGPKGYHLLHADGSLTFIPLPDIRRHVIVERRIDDVMTPIPGLRPIDLLWLKVTGPESQLAKLRKSDIGKHIGQDNFKLDKIPDTSAEVSKPKEKVTPMGALDTLVDEMSETPEQKAKLKSLAREVLS
jgi:DNA repair exonuclease SbcCD nuclease subunit